MDPKADWKGATRMLSDLGARNMQLLLKETPKRMSKNGWGNLKRRFMRKYSPHNERVVAAVKQRIKSNQSLLDAFTWAEKRTLLSLLIPSDLDVSPSEETRWQSCTRPLVRHAFLDRFEGVRCESLRRYLDRTDNVPLGMSTVAEKALAAKAAMKDEIARLQVKQKEMGRYLRRCERLEGDLKKDTECPAAKITKSIESILGKKATEHYHDGHSTYAEPTTASIQKLAKAIPLLRSEDIILDLGSGAATTLWHLCQHHGCRGIGVEYGAHRLQLAANYTTKLIRDNEKYNSFNANVMNTYGDIMALPRLPPCTVLYLFDEAFPRDLMEKIFQLINNAPGQLRYILSSKGGRHASWKDTLIETCHGVTRVLDPIRIRKIGSGEGSAFQLFQRNVASTDGTAMAMDSSLYTEFWNSTTADKIQYYESLAIDMAADAEASKVSRKQRASQ